MKRKFLQLCLISGLLSFGSCVGDDIDDLQDQIDGLTEQVGEMEKAQQEALLTQIAQLQALITELQSENSELTGEYELLLQKLQTLQQEVEDGENSIHYGNVLTEADFAAVVESGASIITGKVAATSQAHVEALANVKLIGGYLEINGATTVDLPNLENVAGDLIISGVNEEAAVVTLPKLASVGGDFNMTTNQGVVSVVADELVLIYGKLSLEENLALTSISMSKLDVINELYINEYNQDDPNYTYLGQLVDLNLSQTDVKTDVNVSYLGEGAKLSLGKIGNDFVCYKTGVDTLEIKAEVISGIFSIENNGSLKTILVDELVRIEGDLNINSNQKSSGMGGTPEGLSSLVGFESLEFIGGNVKISGNSALTKIDAFNNVTEIQGTSIEITYNGNEKELVSIFTALVTTGPSNYSHASITINEKTEWFYGFTALEKAKDVKIQLKRTMDASYAEGEVCRFDGFEALTEVNYLELTAYYVTEFSAFHSLNNFKKYGEYMKLYVPADETVGLCSMEPVLTKIKNGDFDNAYNQNVKATFKLGNTEMDRDEAIARCLAPCN